MLSKHILIWLKNLVGLHNQYFNMEENAKKIIFLTSKSNSHKNFFFITVVFIVLTSCSKPAETKEEFIQKGIIMSDTLLKSVDRQLKDAELAVDSAIKLGLYVPPPPTTITQQSTNSSNTSTVQSK